MSELIGLISRTVGIPQEALYKEQAFWTEFSKELSEFVPSTFKAFARARLCCFYFHIGKSDGRYRTFGNTIDIESLKRSKIKKARLALDFLRGYGIRNIVQSATAYLAPKLLLEDKVPRFLKPKTKELLVVLRSWPNIYNIDLVENRKCPSQYYKGGKFLPFCYSNILLDTVANRTASKRPPQIQPSAQELSANP